MLLWAGILTFDVAFVGAAMFSMLFLIVWAPGVLVYGLIRKSGWVSIGAWVALGVTTMAVDIGAYRLHNAISRSQARKVIAAVESYERDHNTYPERLADMVPGYIETVPPARYCFFSSGFRYSYGEQFQAGPPMLSWSVLPPFGRQAYNFERRAFGYLD